VERERSKAKPGFLRRARGLFLLLRHCNARRSLHSTGQYHKGGPNTAVVFVITSDDSTSTDIPEAGYSFAVLKRAQALGDIEALQAHGRRVVTIHLPSLDAASNAIVSLFEQALG